MMFEILAVFRVERRGGKGYEKETCNDPCPDDASTALMAGCGGQEDSAGSSEDSGSASEETANV